MTSVYPGALDTLTNPPGADFLDETPHAELHTNENDALTAVQETMGLDPQGSEADVAARIAAIEEVVLANYSAAGLPVSVIGTDTASATTSTSMVLDVPGGIQAGDLMIIVAAGHNATVSSPTAGTWDLREAVDTDASEPVYMYTKLATGSEPSTYTLTHTSTSNWKACALVVLRGPTTLRQINAVDGSLVTYSAMNGQPNGVFIGVWLSALAAGTQFAAPGSMTQALSFRAASSEPAFLVAYAPTTHAFPIGTFTATAAGISGNWLINVAMVWT